jgi:transposase-like protein
MTVNLTNPIFHDETAARKHVEALRWPNGPVCTNEECKAVNEATELKGKSHRPGLYKCWKCGTQFTVLVGSIYEDSHLPLTKWLLATHLMCASKKGVSALQIQRMLGLGSYRTAWHLCHRIREAMTPKESDAGPIGGGNKVVESDETYVGGKAKNVHNGKPEPKKHAVVTLVERGGEVRAKHVANVTAKNVKEHLHTNVDKASWLMTDDSKIYVKTGKSFSGHSSVNHSAEEYVRLGGFIHVNTAESFHAIIKRQMYGAHHAVSEHHLQRYINEIAFKWNNRISLGIDDTARAEAAVKGGEGKRLMYRQPCSAA